MNLTDKKDKYFTLYNSSITPGKREEFWNEQSKQISWIKPPSLQNTLKLVNPPFYYWFTDGSLNVCYNVLDRHIKEGNGNVLALVSHCAYTNKTESYTYQQMYIQVNKFSQLLLNEGITKGDTVIIYMPMIAESIFAMLACCRIGAIHSVVFGGFASAELADRIVDAKPKIIITSSVGIEPRKKIPYFPLVLDALKLAHFENLKICLIQRDVQEVSIEDINKHSNSIIFNDAISKMPDSTYVEPVEMLSNDPFYILYTSGTTGSPKGIVRDCGGSLVAMHYTMKNIMNVHKRDSVFSTGDIGWVVGHVFVVYGPLLRGATTIIMEGKPIGTPNCAKCWEIIDQYRVKAFYTAPTALRAIRKEDPDYKMMHKSNLSSLESIHMAGERCDPNTFAWIQEGVGKDKLINDQWWQTESGYPICCNNIKINRFPNKPGSALKPQPGFNVKILDEDNNEVDQGKTGRICIELPMPPAFMLTLWGNDQAFIDRYITQDNKYYISGDCGYFDEDGDIFIMARIDDMIKTAGHRLSTGRMEEVLTCVAEISEAAVVPVLDELKGELPFGFIVLNNNVNASDIEKIRAQAKERIVKEIGAISRLKDAIIVDRLPKNKSGKIIRALLKQIINKEQYIIPSTIEYPEVIEEIKEALIKHNH